MMHEMQNAGFATNICSGEGVTCAVIYLLNRKAIISNYHLFRFVKDQLRGQRYETTEAIQKAVRLCLRMTETEFYRRGIFKLPERWKKCVQRSGDYVKKVM